MQHNNNNNSTTKSDNNVVQHDINFSFACDTNDTQQEEEKVEEKSSDTQSNNELFPPTLKFEDIKATNFNINAAKVFGFSVKQYEGTTWQRATWTKHNNAALENIKHILLSPPAAHKDDDANNYVSRFHKPQSEECAQRLLFNLNRCTEDGMFSKSWRNDTNTFLYVLLNVARRVNRFAVGEAADFHMTTDSVRYMRGLPHADTTCITVRGTRKVNANSYGHRVGSSLTTYVSMSEKTVAVEVFGGNNFNKTMRLRIDKVDSIAQDDGSDFARSFVDEFIRRCREAIDEAKKECRVEATKKATLSAFPEDRTARTVKGFRLQESVVKLLPRDCFVARNLWRDILQHGHDYRSYIFVLFVAHELLLYGYEFDSLWEEEEDTNQERAYTLCFKNNYGKRYYGKRCYVDVNSKSLTLRSHDDDKNKVRKNAVHINDVYHSVLRDEASKLVSRAWDKGIIIN